MYSLAKFANFVRTEKVAVFVPISPQKCSCDKNDINYDRITY